MRGGVVDHEHHILGQEPRPVLADQYLCEPCCGRVELHDQPGVQTDLDGIEDGDPERQEQRSRDVDRGAQRHMHLADALPVAARTAAGAAQAVS